MLFNNLITYVSLKEKLLSILRIIEDKMSAVLTCSAETRTMAILNKDFASMVQRCTSSALFWAGFLVVVVIYIHLTSGKLTQNDKTAGDCVNNMSSLKVSAIPVN